MTTPAFSVNVKETTSAIEIEVGGEIDLSTAPELSEVLSSVLDQPRPVTVDLGDVAFMDSSGLRVLLEGARRLEARGDELVLKNVQPNVRQVFDLAGVESLFAFVTDGRGAAGD